MKSYSLSRFCALRSNCFKSLQRVRVSAGIASPSGGERSGYCIGMVAQWIVHGECNQWHMITEGCVCAIDTGICLLLHTLLGGPRGVTEVTEDTTRYSYLQIGEDTGRYGKLQNSIF